MWKSPGAGLACRGRRLQEVFGLPEAPRLAGGRIPLALELLTPAGRPAAVRGRAGRWAALSRLGSSVRGRRDAVLAACVAPRAVSAHPAQRALCPRVYRVSAQITSDLESFWANVYPEVRKELYPRYPKHPWPEDPLQVRAPLCPSGCGAAYVSCVQGMAGWLATRVKRRDCPAHPAQAEATRLTKKALERAQEQQAPAAAAAAGKAGGPAASAGGKGAGKGGKKR